MGTTAEPVNTTTSWIIANPQEIANLQELAVHGSTTASVALYKHFSVYPEAVLFPGAKLRAYDFWLALSACQDRSYLHTYRCLQSFPLDPVIQSEDCGRCVTGGASYALWESLVINVALLVWLIVVLKRRRRKA